MEGRVTGEPRPDGSLMNQQLTYESEFSAAKMRFAIVAGKGPFAPRRFGRCGPAAVRLTQAPAEGLPAFALTASQAGPRPPLARGIAGAGPSSGTGDDQRGDPRRIGDRPRG
jgi:hypothetical protein